jgi:hypothetical protein
MQAYFEGLNARMGPRAHSDGKYSEGGTRKYKKYLIKQLSETSLDI